MPVSVQFQFGYGFDGTIMLLDIQLIRESEKFIYIGICFKDILFFSYSLIYGLNPENQFL